MSLSLVAAWRAIHLGLAAALLIQSLELLVLRGAWGKRGIWRWSSLSKEHGKIGRFLLAPVLSETGFFLLLLARAIAAAALGVLALFQLWMPPVLLAFLLVSTLLIVLRFRGAFNGGSDSMTLLMLIGACIPAVAPEVKWVARAGLAWIAVQGIASYVLSGLAKLREPGWRSGETLGFVLRSPHYGVPAPVARVLDAPPACIATSWGILAFEIGFPFAFAGPGACLTVVGLGFIFHAVNARVLGLSRFLWIWPVTYPAIVYWVP